MHNRRWITSKAAFETARRHLLLPIGAISLLVTAACTTTAPPVERHPDAISVQGNRFWSEQTALSFTFEPVGVRDVEPAAR